MVCSLRVKIYLPDFGGDNQHAVQRSFLRLKCVCVPSKEHASFFPPKLRESIHSLPPEMDQEVLGVLLAEPVGPSALDDHPGDHVIDLQVDLQPLMLPLPAVDEASRAPSATSFIFVQPGLLVPNLQPPV